LIAEIAGKVELDPITAEACAGRESSTLPDFRVGRNALFGNTRDLPMKILWLVMLVQGVFFAPLSMAAHYKVFVLTGQSNSLGTTGGGEADPSPGSDPADAQMRFFWHNRVDENRTLGDSRGKFTGLQEQQGGVYAGDATHWGPEIGFGRTWIQNGGGSLAIVKSSRGGGGNGLWSKEDGGHMYQQVVETVQAATDILSQEGNTFEIAALLYLQGESDSAEEAELAGKRLEALATYLRQDLPGAKNMKLICGGIAAEGPSRDRVRENQEAAVSSNAQMAYFDNRDLRDQLYDGLHFSKAAKLVVGQRFAKAYREKLGGGTQ
jgi:hypothetical protein